MPAPIVFFDIAGPDNQVLIDFYSIIFGWQIGQNESFSTAVVSPTVAPPTLMGTIRKDPTEKVFYVEVDDINSNNRIGLVEMENGKAKTP